MLQNYCYCWNALFEPLARRKSAQDRRVTVFGRTKDYWDCYRPWKRKNLNNINVFVSRSSKFSIFPVNLIIVLFSCIPIKSIYLYLLPHGIHTSHRNLFDRNLIPFVLSLIFVCFFCFLAFLAFFRPYQRLPLISIILGNPKRLVVIRGK